MQKIVVFLLFKIIILLFKSTLGGNLQARPSETREVVSLDGLWHFTTNANFSNNVEDANDLDINLMPVPSSYNDISTRKSLRDHVGAVWYQRKFYVPKAWQENKVWIRFGSVCYNASVTINGQVVVTHQIGHLPFLAEITSAVTFGQENTIIVEVNNILTMTTIPQGSLSTFMSGQIKQDYKFDFFNYAGIDRPVVLYTTSNIGYVDDINIDIQLNGTSGLVSYDITTIDEEDLLKLKVNILDKNGNVVASSSTLEKSEILTVENATLWWPYLMDPNPGYMYNLEVVVTQDDILVDHYKQPFGIRQLKYDNDSFTINGKNIYIAGFGRHEDSDIRGKGMDLPLIIRDYNLIRWIGANCYRTSHYPYAEEIMDMADQLGIMIIDEVPSTGTKNFTDELMTNHKNALTELHRRDKNRPSVVVWSMANEPRSETPDAEDYFRGLSAHIKSLDTSRPITIANMYGSNSDYSGQFLDLLGFNKYESWYTHVGEIDGIYERILSEARQWREQHNKPVLVTEYGADSINGLTLLPSYIWSEEYHLDVMEQNFRAFDELRSEGWFVGEMIWNFADFKTDQGIKRVGGNRKGMFTRDRQPKASVFLLRKRYWALAEKLNNATLPNDLDKYVIDPDTFERRHDEL